MISVSPAVCRRARMINYTERITVLDAGHRRARAGARVSRPGRPAGLRAVRPVGRRRRVRDLPLPHAAADATRATTTGAIGAAAGSRGAPSGSSPSRRRCPSAGRPIHYLISFALPRFCDQTLERSRKRRFYPGGAGVDREARHDRARAVSHRPGAGRASARIERRDGGVGRAAHGRQFLRAGRGDGAAVPGQRARSRACTSSCATASPSSTSSFGGGGGDDVPDVPVVSAALHRDARARSRRARRAAHPADQAAAQLRPCTPSAISRRASFLRRRGRERHRRPPRRAVRPLAATLDAGRCAQRAAGRTRARTRSPRREDVERRRAPAGRRRIVAPSTARSSARPAPRRGARRVDERVLSHRDADVRRAGPVVAKKTRSPAAMLIRADGPAGVELSIDARGAA